MEIRKYPIRRSESSQREWPKLVSPSMGLEAEEQAATEALDSNSRPGYNKKGPQVRAPLVVASLVRESWNRMLRWLTEVSHLPLS